MVQVIREQSLLVLCLWAAVQEPQLNTKCLSEAVAGQRPESSTSSSCVVLYQATKIHRAAKFDPKSSTITIKLSVFHCMAISLHYISPHKAESGNVNHSLLLIGHHHLLAWTERHRYRNQRRTKKKQLEHAEPKNRVESQISMPTYGNLDSH